MTSSRARDLARSSGREPARTSRAGRGGGALLGLSLCLVALAANRTPLGWTLAADGHVEGGAARTAIVALQVLLFGAGVVLLLGRGRVVAGRGARGAALLLLLVAAFGARGADHVTHILTEDMTSAMIQMGITRPDEARGQVWTGR